MFGVLKVLFHSIGVTYNVIVSKTECIGNKQYVLFILCSKTSIIRISYSYSMYSPFANNNECELLF
jgi:hypothetical protein